MITNGVDIYKYANENRKEKFENIFLYWGRIAINKGIFESIVKLSDYHSDFVFNIIGVCEDEEYMYKLVSYINEKSMGNKIRFLGSLVDGQIKEYINQADIILMPSLHEGFGMTLTECLLSNRPIIANTNESYKYILEYCGASRYLFDYLDPNSKIENKIKELCENIVSPQNVNEFSVDNMIKRTMDIYKS